MVTVLAAAHLAGAVAVFAVFSFAGTLLRTSQLSVEWQYGTSALGLLFFASLDLLAIKNSTYSPLTWRRQVPKCLMRRHSRVATAAAWGFDTGLAFTTFRVATITWGALALTALGLAPWWIGFGYGLGFVIPLVFLICRHRVGRCSRSPIPENSGLEILLGRRTVVQRGSAALLGIGAMLLTISLVTNL